MENALVETSRPLRLSGRLEVIRRYMLMPVGLSMWMKTSWNGQLL